jgi:alkaline phosphatase D
MPLTRRHFLQGAAPLTLAPLVPSCNNGRTHDEVFAHGVASGDPLANAVILWTRVTPLGKKRPPVTVTCVVTRDIELHHVVFKETVTTSAERDYTLKVDAVGLEPGTTYYYYFRALGERSPVGRTRTLPTGAVERLRLGVTSCSNYPYGYFNVYAALAERDELDLVLHLGDYMYEYANGEYGDGSFYGRVPEPNREIVTLEDYRQRHAQYKCDRDLQAAHAAHPFVTVWDDHESANDAFKDGAVNHHPETQGDWQQRKANAIRAYHEWMPIRELWPDDLGRIYRSFAVGDLLDLVLLDTRLYGRDKQATDACDMASLADPRRQLLGTQQLGWLFDELGASQERGARWRLIGQQVMFGQLLNVMSPLCAANTDQWDGYTASRDALFDFFERQSIDNIVILTGDIHSSWALDVSPHPFDPDVYDAATGRGSRAVELIAPAVTSPGIDDPLSAANLAASLRDTHPHVKYVDLHHRGFLTLDVSHERIVAEWYHMSTIIEPSSEYELAARVEVRAGDNHLTPFVARPGVAVSSG